MRRGTLVVLLAAAACGTGSTTGVGVALRHGPGEITDPVAVGAKLALGVHHGERPSLIGPYLYVAGTVTVKDENGNDVPATALGTGEFDTVLPAPGKYAVTATTDRGETTVTVTARAVASLLVAGRTVTTQASGGARCWSSVAVDPLPMRVNQYVEVTLAARSVAGESLVGELDVDVLDLGVTVNRPLLSTGGNSYVVTPKGHGSIGPTFTHRTSGASVKLNIEHDSMTMAACP